MYADDGLVACSEFSYTTTRAERLHERRRHARARAAGSIRDNRFAADPRAASRTAGEPDRRSSCGQRPKTRVVERNVIVDSFRGIALGLESRCDAASRPRTRVRSPARRHPQQRHRQPNPWADEAIEANAARDVRIEHNTVFVEGTLRLVDRRAVPARASRSRATT